MKARENPFSSSRILKVRYIPQATDFDQLISRLKALHYRAAIVGPEGSGKTTLLEDLSRRFPPIRWFSLTLDLPVPRFNFDPDDFVFVDGAGLLNRSEWKHLLRIPCKGLVVTMHQQGQLPTLIECATNLDLLVEITRRLIGDQTELLPGVLSVLYQRHNGNLRDVLRELYDMWANDRYLDLPFLELSEDFRSL